MTIIEQARKIRADMNTVTATLSDEQGLDLIALFEPWQSGTAYAVGDRRRHGETLYKCVQAHTSLADWTPDTAVSLWVRIDDPAIEWPAWVQPTGATDAYTKGAKVTHKDSRWVSTAENNVWEPGAYGWDKQA